MTYNDFLFYFVGGTCGSFVKRIFTYYLDVSCGHPPGQLLLDTKLGHCHGYYQIQHYHWPQQCACDRQLNPMKKLVIIDFDEDDKPNIIRMAVSKIIRFQIQEDSNFLVNRWGSVFEGTTDLNEIEKFFINNPDFLIFPEWKNNLSSLNPALTITYKDIMFGDLNTKIAKFFEITPREEIASFINEYRNCNAKYIL